MRNVWRLPEHRTGCKRTIATSFLNLFGALGAVLPVLLSTSPARADGLGLAKSFQTALEGGSAGTALLLSFAAGLATSLTPCVYPMIAITVSVFGARAAQTRREGALLSTAFVGGMAVLFTALGIGAAMTGGVFGDELGSPVVAFALAAVFVLMAAAMFGAFELALPSSVTTKLSEMGGIGYKGAFVLGMVTSLIAAPCVGPVLGLLLPWVGSTGNIAFGAACTLSYALGLGCLFWVVGTFAVALPKSGRWMEWVKSGFALVMLGSALYFVRLWIPGYEALRRGDLLYLALGAIGVGLALGAVHLSFSGGSIDRLRKASGIVTCSAGMLLLLGSFEAKPLQAGEWEHDLLAARAKAKEADLPMLVDFGASWCQACGELERETFSDPRVIAESQRFVRIKVDLSPGAEIEQGEAWLEEYGARGLPLVVLHDRSGHESARITEFVEPDDMLQLMQAVQ
jgi:thiol:disulfide interchange protein DsbD